MGAADTVPGVSGGTIALIVGIYERLVRAITSLDPRVLVYVPRLYEARYRERVRRELVAMDVPFLVVLGVGVVSAVVALSSVMHRAVTSPSVAAPTFGFFIGLIVASAVVLYRHVAIDSPRRVMVALVGIVFAAGVAGTAAEQAATDPAMPVVFVAGGVAVVAMVLPGISGAFILLLLGLYTYMSGVPGAFLGALIAVMTGSSVGVLVGPGVPLVAFVGGAILGLFSIAHVVRWALERYRAATLTFLVALMIGALRAPVSRIRETGVEWTPSNVVIVGLVIGVGGVVVLVLDRYTDELKY